MRNEVEDLKQQAVEMGKQQLKNMVKESAKKVGKEIWEAILPYLPYVIAAILILVVIVGCVDWDDVTASAALDEMNNATGVIGLDVNHTNLTKEEFVKAVKEYRENSSYQTKFAQYAENIYDICTSKNINPVLCVSQAGVESNFGAAVPSNSPWNYWGLAVYNDTNVGKEFSSINDAITCYCDYILGYQQEGSIAYQKAQEYSEYNEKITGNMNSIYDVLCAYMYLGDYHSGHIFGNVNVKQYLTQYMHFPCTHEESAPTTKEEQAAYVVSYIDNNVVRIATEIFGDSVISIESGEYNSDFYGGIEIYNNDGSVNSSKMDELERYLTNMLNTCYHEHNNVQQSGPFPKWWTTNNNMLDKFQCTWWAKGRASQYLELTGNKYKEYPRASDGFGNGGLWYTKNQQNGWFNYGQTPKKNSIISWKGINGNPWGHVAYVEAVDTNGDIWVSHAGGGNSWYGVQKLTASSNYYCGSTLSFNGFIYLDEPK